MIISKDWSMTALSHNGQPRAMLGTTKSKVDWAVLAALGRGMSQMVC